MINKAFTGWRGIFTGGLSLFLGNLVISPYDWGSFVFIACFVTLIIFSVTLILYGVFTLSTNEKAKKK